MTQDEVKRKMHITANMDLVDVIDIKETVPELKKLPRRGIIESIEEMRHGMNQTFQFRNIALNHTNDHLLQVKFEKVLEIGQQVVDELKSSI